MKLRNFLYLDAVLVEQFLAQLEGGVYDEEEQSETSARARGASAGARAGPLGAQLSGSRSGEQTTKRTVRLTPEANFGRLETLLDEQNSLQCAPCRAHIEPRALGVHATH